MPSETYVSLVDLCRVLAGCGVTYAMARRDIADPLSFLKEWAAHLRTLAAKSDDPILADAMTCIAGYVLETIPEVERKRRHHSAASRTGLLAK
jgi:hypothetical protein